MEQALNWAALIFAVAFAVLVARLWPVLSELKNTLSTYRNLEPKITLILDNSRRISSNVEEISRQVLLQSGRIDHMTDEASQMVESVKKTVDLYNRTIARPAIFAASMASGIRGVTKVLMKKKE